MEKITKKILKLRYVNDQYLSKLSKEDYDIFIDKLYLIHTILPIHQRYLPSIINSYKDYLKDSMVNNRYHFINSTYFAYVKHVIKDCESFIVDACDYYFHQKDEESVINILSNILLFLTDSIVNVYPTKCNQEEDEEFKVLFNKFIYYRELCTDYDTIPFIESSFYSRSLRYITAYFVSNDKLIGNIDYYQKVIEFFIENLDYIYSSYNLNFPKDSTGSINISNINDKICIGKDIVEKYEKKLAKKRID